MRLAALALGGALGLAMLASSAPSLAGTVRMTNTATAQYRLFRFLDGEDRGEEVPYGLLLDRLNLVAATGGFDTAVRIDGALFFDPPVLDESKGEFRDDARIERFLARYGFEAGGGDLKLMVGDIYRQLGRGILLSLRKEDEIGVDIALRGGQVQWLSRSVDGSLFVGRVNPVNLDNVSEQFQGELIDGYGRWDGGEGPLMIDPQDIIAGAEVKLRELGPVQVALHGVYLGLHTQLFPDIADDDHTLGAGGTVEIPSLGEVGSLFVEVDWQRARQGGSDTDGLAAYGVAELYLDPVSLVVEGLYLDSMGLLGGQSSVLRSPFVYNQPPTVERIDQEVLNNRDVLGGRARLDYSLLEGDLTVYVNGMLRKTDPGVTAEVTQLHGYGGFDLYYAEGSSRLGASGGWRDEQNTPPGGSASDVKSMVHAEGDWLHAFEGWSLHVATLNELRTLASPTGDDAYRRGSALVGVEFGHDAGWMQRFADQIALTFEFGYDDQDQSPGARNLYYAGIVDWTVDRRLRLRAVGGTQRGGLKCVGGVCRIYPEFAGGRLDIITTLDL